MESGTLRFQTQLLGDTGCICNTGCHQLFNAQLAGGWFTLKPIIDQRVTPNYSA